MSVVDLGKMADMSSHGVGGNRKCHANTIEEHRSDINTNSVFDCHLSPTGYKRQSKTLFLSIFYPRSLIFLLRFRLPPTRCGVVKFTIVCHLYV